MNTYDRGTAILITVEFKKQTPFGTANDYDPATSQTIDIVDPGGNVMFAAAPLTKVGVGQYEYVCQTAASWWVGTYTVKATAVDGSSTSITYNRQAFTLQ